MVTLTEIEITFCLPEWVTNKEFWWIDRIYYDKSHVWAGQVKEDKHRSYIFDRIFMMEGLIEYCDHPWGPWAKFKVEDASVNTIIKCMDRLHNLLREFKDEKDKR